MGIYSGARKIVSPQFAIPGRYFTSLTGDTTSNVSMGANEIRYIPFIIQVATTFDRIGVNVTTAQTGGEARLGIRSVGSNGLPGNLFFDAGIIDCSTTGAKEITISQAPPAGQYYAMILNKIASTSINSVISTPISGSILGQTSIGTTFHCGFVVNGVTYAAFANNPESSTPTPNTIAPLITLRLA